MLEDRKKIDVKNERGQFVNYLALVIIILSSGILIVLISMASNNLGAKDGESFKGVKELLNILLPLVGTWMGTILAFYFSRDNFEAANNSVQQMVKQITTDEKLQEFKASDVMIK